MKDQLDKIWQQCDKPKKFADYKVKDFFSLDFVTLSNKTVASQVKLWNSEIADLQERFNPQHERTIFSLDQQNQKTGIGALSSMTKEVWTIIRDDKDLKMPELREQAAEMRCIEIRDETLLKLKTATNELEATCRKSFHANFKRDCESILSQALEFYNSEAKQYRGKAFKKT